MKGRRAGSPQCCERAGEAADRCKAGSRGGVGGGMDHGDPVGAAK
jgi:hypothetical protein